MVKCILGIGNVAVTCYPNVLTSWSPVANCKAGPDYSVFIMKYFPRNFTWSLRYYRVPPGIRVPQAEDQWFRRTTMLIVCYSRIEQRSVLYVDVNVSKEYDTSIFRAELS
jgi:hypothetical protein